MVNNHVANRGNIDMIIYEARNKINGKRYIGQTIHTLEERKRGHISSMCCSYFRRALDKYGVDSFEWNIIDTAETRDELNRKESYWIEFYDTTNRDKGYNLKGDGYNPFLTDRVKKAIGDAQRGELNHMYGKYGKNNPSSIPVIDITTGIKYDSVSDMCRVTNFGLSRVCCVCRGERYTHKGHVFRYLDKDGNIIDNGIPTDIKEIKKIKKNNTKDNMAKIKILDETNNVLYESLIEAVGKRYVRSLSRKIRTTNEDTFVYHGISWRVIK